MFFDWLSIHQDHASDLPVIGDRYIRVYDTGTGEDIGGNQPTHHHAGSYSTTINIRISGNRVTVTGNPSRINRLDNLFGYTSIDQCVEVYNRILAKYGLPPFTKNTNDIWKGTAYSSTARMAPNGAVITELHVTSNCSVGAGNVEQFIKGISSLPYRHMEPRLHTNGQTCDWLTKTGKGGRLIYPSVYNKAFEINLHSLPKIKRTYGDKSAEYKYLKDLINFCHEHGIVRFEQKLKSDLLRREGLNYYGFDHPKKLRSMHQEFLDIQQKLKVEAMTLESITETLIAEGVCTGTRSANATSIYAIQWMHGHTFDLKKSQVQTHRARLRKIGIDIAMKCDISKFSLVTVKETRAIEVGTVSAPHWYRKPQGHLRLAA
ncbi:phage/plasmid replication protein [Microbulbifer sp. OS29]|uniref:Phage/plasmid replication protein n=1 Tax=Microbulbifer okhotskensis TaxID=2926617 RepID=A0A9X2ERM2_9GAMM|nr:phage/plasmid replication protein [Microbulbifer okhotskensis]MCO1336125.1 phage/plasmid replication protein [Microbulbifer okhotskensis]